MWFSLRFQIVNIQDYFITYGTAMGRIQNKVLLDFLLAQNATVMPLWIYAIILTAYTLLGHQTRWLVQNVTAFVVFVFRPHTKSAS